MPERIYRYQPFNALSLDAICHDQIYFSDPSNFNDPLDCKPSVKCDSDVVTLRDVLHGLIKRRVSEEVLNSLKSAKVDIGNAVTHSITQGMQEADNEIKYIAYQATDPYYECSVEEAEIIQLLYRIQVELLKQNSRGVCCFSEEFNNPLLWSHYGDQHNGFCVGYSLDRKPRPIVNKVMYGGVRTVNTSLIAKAIIDNDVDAQKIIDENIFLRKAFPWNYENEWRILGEVGLQDSPLKLEEVIFGIRTSCSVMHAVIEALKPRDVKFYSMYSVGDSFELQRTSDIGEMCAHLPRTSRSGVELFGPVSST